MASIMVVDDDHHITKLLGVQLGEMGHTMVGSASSGCEAVKLARRLMPDLILMDIVMPEMDGIDAARTIWEEMDIPSIFLTGYRDIEYLNRAMDLEPYGYLYKPPKREAIHAAIETALARRNSDRTLRELYEGCLEILENTSEMLLVVIGENIVSAGPSVTITLGHDVDDIIERPIIDLIHPDDRVVLARLLGNTNDTGVSTNPVLIRMLHRTGAVRWTSHVITPITWRGERAFLCAATDVTEYIKREHELTVYRRIIDKNHCGIAVTDADRVIIYVNSSLADMLGYTDTELIGMKISELCLEEDTTRENDFMNTILESGGHPVVELRHRRKDGSPVPVLIGGILLTDDTGNPEYIARTVLDITRFKETEKHLSGLINTLIQRNEDIRGYAAIVSHDLRIPLIRIKHLNRRFRDYLDIIADAFSDVTFAIPEKTRERFLDVIQHDMPEGIGSIEQSITRLERMAAAIKRLTRYGSRLIETKPVDTAHIVASCLEHWRPLIESGRVQVQVDALPEVAADREALELIFTNLIDNAVKFLDGNRFGLVEISAAGKDDCVEFRIADNGRGIDPDDIDRIFQVFQRGKETDTPGDGMGLAFVKILVERHGGEIRCESTVGVGSVFTFTIPAPAPDGAVH